MTAEPRELRRIALSHGRHHGRVLRLHLLIGGPRSGPLVLIVVGCGLVTVAALLLIGETKKRNLAEPDQPAIPAAIRN